MWTADLGDGRTEVMTASWWSSRTDIEGFAGQNIDVAVFYPEDDDYLIDRETTVMHLRWHGHYDTCPDVPRSRPGPTATQESLASAASSGMGYPALIATMMYVGTT
jgi:hypothetical protein